MLEPLGELQAAALRLGPGTHDAATVREAAARGLCAMPTHADRRMACTAAELEVYMSLTMIVVIVVLVVMLGGGGYYWRR